MRGNGKIIQELEAQFRGAGWNVIKVIWGSKWDALLARDVDGALLNKMNTTVDGEFQRYTVESGAYIREHFFGPDPRLRRLVEHLSDDELRLLPRGGHDYRKLYAAYKAAVENEGSGAPTVILAKTIKGWTLGPDVEGRNATHQIKKMTTEQLRILRDRLMLHTEIPEESLDAGDPPYYRPPVDSVEYQYMAERRRVLDGAIPRRVVRARRPLELPADTTFNEVTAGSGNQAVSTTMAFTRLVRNLTRDERFGPRVVPIIPDEARTFGMDALFREVKIYASQGQRYEPVDADLLLSYSEAKDGQILEEGITEAGALSSFIAAGTSYAHRGVPMVPFYIFYSMFGFQRVGDLIWLAADARTRGFLLGATAGRTTLLGEGLQHQDGQSLLLASAVPPCQAYDPAFAYEMATIVKHGLRRMYGPQPEDVFFYLTLYNENYQMPAMPPGVEDGIMAGLYKWADAPDGPAQRATVLFSGSANGAARAARDRAGREVGRRRRAVVSDLVQGAARRGAHDRTLEPVASVAAAAHAARGPAARRCRGADRRGHRLHEGRARAGRAVRRTIVRPARHRRVRPVRHPRVASPPLRGRRAQRRRGGARLSCRNGRREARDRARRDRSLRHRPRGDRPGARLARRTGFADHRFDQRAAPPSASQLPPARRRGRARRGARSSLPNRARLRASRHQTLVLLVGEARSERFDRALDPFDAPIAAAHAVGRREGASTVNRMILRPNGSASFAVWTKRADERIGASHGVVAVPLGVERGIDSRFAEQRD